MQTSSIFYLFGATYVYVAKRPNPSRKIKTRSGSTPATRTYILKSNFNPSIK